MLNLKKDPNRYLKLLNIHPENALAKISELSSALTGEHHQIRSIILELQAWVEIQVRQYLYFYLRGMILYKDKDELISKSKKLQKNIEGMMFGQMWKLMEHAIEGSPWPDLLSIPEINSTRNKVAHNNNANDVTYKGRNPFFDIDCLAQLYFDCWAISQTMPKLFHKTIEASIENLQYYRTGYYAYREKFGELEFEYKYKSPFEK